MDWLLIGPLIATFAWPLALTWILTACHIRVARDFGLIDQPCERKFHKQPTPTGAGLALFAAVTVSAGVLASVCALDWTLWNEQFFFASLIVVLGLLDDHRSLPWLLRLFVHILAAMVAMRTFDLWFEEPWQFRVFGALWIVMLINAFNFMDNMDGLCAGITFIVAACVALSQAYLQDPFQSLPVYRNVGINSWHLLMLMGALAGFLWFNRPPARVFMGDTGSTFLGFFLGVASVPLFVVGEKPVQISDDWLAPVCMFALPIYDLLSVAGLRVWQGRGLFVSDRNNLSHRLVELGMRPTRAVALLWLLAMVGGVGGLLIYLVPQPVKMILGAAQIVGWSVALPFGEYVAHRRLQNQPEARAKA